jgi:hypothetical protein
MSEPKMKMKLALTVVAMILATTFMPSTLNAAGAKKYVTAQIEFDSVPLEWIVQTAQTHHLAIAEIHHVFSIGDQQFVGFFPVPQDVELDQIGERLLEAHQRFLQDMVYSIETESSESLESSSQWERPQDMGILFHKALENAALMEPQVTRMTVQGRLSAIEGIRNTSSTIQRIEVFPPNGQSYVLFQANSSDAGMSERSPEYSTMAVSPGTWVPREGNVSSGQSGALYRYVTVSMLWNNVSGFDANSTFEPDLFLNNNGDSQLGRGTYLDRSQMITGIPVVYYAASSLPRPYLDTRLGDPANEVAYTIGSSKASDIKVNQWYYNYIQVLKGDADRDNAKLTAQLGYRWPSWCYNSTWCSYSRGDVPQERIINAWDIPVPGYKSWRR